MSVGRWVDTFGEGVGVSASFIGDGQTRSITQSINCMSAVAALIPLVTASLIQLLLSHVRTH